MPENPLFGDVLEDINAGNVLRTEARPQLLQRVAPLKPGALGATHIPSNQQILDAARQQYHAKSSVVDNNTMNGFHYVKTSAAHHPVHMLNVYDWKSRDAGKITPTAKVVADAPIIKPGVDQALADSDVVAFNIGISESAQFIVGEEGGVGIAFDTAGNFGGTAYLAGKLGLDIDLAVNLQLGIWAADVAGLAGDFVGLEVNLDLDVGVSLGIFMHPNDLSFYGFSIGIGVGVGGGVTVVGGYTVVF